MTLTGPLATTIVLFTLAGTNASGESSTHRALAPAGAGNQRPDGEGGVGVVGHRRTLTLHKKRKHKKPGGSTPEDSGAGKSAEPEKASDSGDAGDETPAAAEPDLNKKKAKASDDGATGDKAPAAAEPEIKKKAKASDDDAAGGETPGSAKSERDDEVSWPHPEALALAVGPRLMARSLTYAQDIYNRNSRYSLPAAPMAGLAADFYPAALFTDGLAANLGLTADVGYLLPVVSTAPPSGPGSYGARSLSWSAGAKVRLPMGIFATVAYGDQRYELAPSGGAMGINIPTTEYKFVRGGAGIRYQATPDVSLMANAAYLHCLSLGQIGAAGYFPKGTGAAFETGVALGFRLTPMFEVRGGLDVRRYGLAFHQRASDFVNPENDPTLKIAGGAIDQYISTWFALAVVMDGYSSHAGGRTHGGGGAAAPPGATKIQDEAPADQ